MIQFNKKRMAIIIRTICAITICVFSFLLFGCSCKNSLFPNISSHCSNDVESVIRSAESKGLVLTERQKEILIHEGVTEEEIASGTFYATPAIEGEKMLRYLEEKYPNEQFEFYDFKSAEYMAFEKVSNAETIALCQYGKVTVSYAGDSNELEDNYPFTVVSYIAKNDFVNYMQKKLGREFKVYGVEGETEITDIRNINKEALSGTTALSCTAFVEQSDDLDVTETGTAIADWYNSLGIYGNTNVIAVNQGTLKNINYDNYDSVKLDQHLSNYLMCEVDSSGGFKVY